MKFLSGERGNRLDEGWDLFRLLFSVSISFDRWLVRQGEAAVQ